MSDQPKFIPMERHRRELAGFRAGIMLRTFYGGFPTMPVDTGRVHGPFLPPCADCGAVVAYGGHNIDCPRDVSARLLAATDHIGRGTREA